MDLVEKDIIRSGSAATDSGSGKETKLEGVGGEDGEAAHDGGKRSRGSACDGAGWEGGVGREGEVGEGKGCAVEEETGQELIGRSLLGRAPLFGVVRNFENCDLAAGLVSEIGGEGDWIAVEEDPEGRVGAIGVVAWAAVGSVVDPEPSSGGGGPAGRVGGTIKGVA